MIRPDHKILPVIYENKKGNSTGIASICSANWYVIKAALLNAKKLNKQVLIESTSNQVNQFGGYTGFIPVTFKDKVYNLAHEIGFPSEDIILGGDHLGPNAWQSEPYEEAFKKAIDQIKAYIIAGFSKIHLDASAKCADEGDNKIPLDSSIIADRTALLCKAAEETCRQIKNDPGTIVYVIGTDVPPPGGAKGEHHSVRITSGEEVEDTILLTRKAFEKYKLQEAWERVIAVVVQPGVEFDDSFIFDYEPKKTINLSEKIKQIENIVYEAHSTDYQKKSSLKQMIRDHYAILKVGPWLTFAFREAVFALAYIENELYDSNDPQYSDILKIIDCVMTENPLYWNNYYSGENSRLKYSRQFSYSDRIRYYWPEKSISGALDKLIYNLKRKTIPLSLISQFLPEEFDAIRNEEISNDPGDLINHKITKILDIYNYATSV